MKASLPVVVLLICMSSVFPAAAADISGVVHVKPRLSESEYQKQMRGVKRDEIYKIQGAERLDYKSAAENVVVYIDEVPGDFTLPEENPRISQKNATFHPVVLPILVGTTVDFPNNDVIFHNVFSYSKTKPFDLGLYKSGASKSVTFTKTGEVTVYCSIHRTMKADLLVLQNPYFTVTDAKGHFKISGVPAGTYTLRAWHERFPTADVQVKVAEEAGEVQAELTLGVIDLPQVE